MGFFSEYLAGIEDAQHRTRLEEVLNWVSEVFPGLAPRIAWRQPMFTDHGTFIAGFSTAKNHWALAPERAGILQFSEEIARAGYSHSKELVHIPWDSPVDYGLLQKILVFNILDKAECKSFWRK